MHVYMGIDWSTKKHDIVLLNEAGAIIARLTIPHQVEGFEQIETTRQQLGVRPTDCLVGMETAHNILIDYLWGHGYEQLFVIPPSVVNSSRGRYGSSGARSDQKDAQLLADILRTDRARLQPWRPDSLLTRQIRAKASLIHHLTKSVIRTSQRLRAVLIRYYPAALELFGGLTAQITLAFLLEYPTPQAAAELSYQAFTDFMTGRRYPYCKWPKQFVRLQRPQPQASRDTVQVFQTEMLLLAAQLLDLVRTNNAQKRELTHLFNQHPDNEIFASLPGAGALLAPSLLAKFGDDRERFPQPSSLQALAGTCPVTDASGKRRRVYFRRACDKEFRHIAQQWARSSLAKSVWANAYWLHVRPRVGYDNDAYRRLANRWLAIAWKLWQTRQPYDEAYHLQQRALRSKPQLS
jgi:transposase